MLRYNLVHAVVVDVEVGRPSRCMRGSWSPAGTACLDEVDEFSSRKAASRWASPLRSSMLKFSTSSFLAPSAGERCFSHIP